MKAPLEDIDIIVKDLLAEKLGLPEEAFTPTARFNEDLGIDSLDLLEVRMELENKFNFIISDEDAEKLPTVGELIIFVKENSKNKNCIGDYRLPTNGNI